MSQPLLFTPPTSSFDPTFWEELYERKLNVYRLTTDEVALGSTFAPSDGRDNGFLKFSKSSFNDATGIQGGLLNKNKVEEFTSTDKVALIKIYGLRILEAIVSGKAVSDPLLLSQFLLLTFADLKAYRFIFWCAQPALALSESLQGSVVNAREDFDPLALRIAYQHLVASPSSSSIFAIRVVDDVPIAMTLYDVWPYRFDDNVTFVCPDQAAAAGAVGWNIRNFITLLSCYSNSDANAYQLSSDSIHRAVKGSNKIVKILALRGPQLPRLMLNTNPNNTETAATWKVDTLCDRDCSVLAAVTLPPCPLLPGFDSTESLTLNSLSPFKVVGWEQNDRGKSGPRVADMRNTLDATLLMQQAVDLNLRLMKWRMWPTLAVDRLSQQRCLLLGSGTLGCAVARALMGWGVRHITFVDNGTVSYSNPVRQSLFEFADCQARRFKAQAAADSVMRIFPGMIAKGVLMSIPMPGHPYNPQSSIAASSGDTADAALTDDAARSALEQLITDHDIIFNLTDSREARWLPTLLCKAIGRQCINAALGFDSYLVMRHGHGEQDLGCYFCNDIVAAANSQRDRTLDEQCTVTRPGLSFIAGALCTEVMVAVIQQQVEAENKQQQGSDEVLSAQYSVEAAPHQIRGSLLGFSQMLLEAPGFPMCTACSKPVIAQYRADPGLFVEQVCADPGVLEIVSGVRAMVEEVDLNLCIDSDEEF